MMTGVVNVLKGLNAKRKAHLYHAKSNRSAALSLQNAEQNKGPLAPGVKQKCDDYASSVLKDIRYAPWLYVYSAVSGEFCEGWLPSNYWGWVIVPKIQGAQGRVSSLKSMTQSIFGSEFIPDLLSYANGIFTSHKDGVIQAKDVKDYLFSSSTRVIFKPDQSLKGRGIEVFRADDFDCEKFQASNMSSGVFQSYIVQHETLASFFPSAVSTLRLCTVINPDGKPELRSAHMRLGTGSLTHVVSKFQVRVSICMETGKLRDIGYTTKWAEISCHPDSQERFAGVDYPNFADAVATVKQLHKAVPFVRCIGWDVCVDNTGKVQVMEWNGRQNGIQFAEATQGPCFTGLGW